VQKPTIGCHYSEIRVAVDNRDIALQVWDTAGQEMSRALVPVCLRGARAGLFVYDVTDAKVFSSLRHISRPKVDKIETKDRKT
jgi:GTPase SAR1 family protein